MSITKYNLALHGQETTLSIDVPALFSSVWFGMWHFFLFFSVEWRWLLNSMWLIMFLYGQFKEINMKTQLTSMIFEIYAQGCILTKRHTDLSVPLESTSPFTTRSMIFEGPDQGLYSLGSQKRSFMPLGSFSLWNPGYPHFLCYSEAIVSEWK